MSNLTPSATAALGRAHLSKTITVTVLPVATSVTKGIDTVRSSFTSSTSIWSILSAFVANLALTGKEKLSFSGKVATAVASYLNGMIWKALSILNIRRLQLPSFPSLPRLSLRGLPSLPKLPTVSISFAPSFGTVTESISGVSATGWTFVARLKDVARELVSTALDLLPTAPRVSFSWHSSYYFLRLHRFVRLFDQAGHWLGSTRIGRILVNWLVSQWALRRLYANIGYLIVVLILVSSFRRTKCHVY